MITVAISDDTENVEPLTRIFFEVQGTYLLKFNSMIGWKTEGITENAKNIKWISFMSSTSCFLKLSGYFY